MGKSINEFAKEISMVMPRLLREFVKKQSRMIEKTGDITLPQMAILHILKDMARCKMTEIAKFLSVTTSAATGIVDRMVKSGLLKRVRDVSDRRIVNIELTTKGTRAINIIFKERQKMMIDIFRHFNSKERETYLGTIKKMYNVMRRTKK